MMEEGAERERERGRGEIERERERERKEERERKRGSSKQCVITNPCRVRNNFDRVLPVAEIVWELDRI